MRTPKSLFATLLVAAIGLSLLSSAGHAAKRTPRCGNIFQSPATATDHQLRTSVLCLVNRARARNGIRPLRFNFALRRSASGHSLNLVRSGSFSHYGPSGSTPTIRVAHAGYLAHTARYRIAENIAAGKGRRFGSPMAIVALWMHSPPHRANILDRRLRDFGVGVARNGRDGATYTLVFGSRSR
jgi:uncharacterized protein YkwD